MNELILVKLLLSKNDFQKYYPALDVTTISETHREVGHLYKTLVRLHEETPEHDLSLDELQAYFWASFPDAPREVYTALFQQLAEAIIGPDAASAVLTTIYKRQQMLKVSEQAFKASQGFADVQSVTDLLDEVDKPKLEDVTDDSFISTNIEEIVRDTVSKPGIRWPIECLNKAVGSLRKGDFGFIFARPETGKTTFIASVAASSLNQIEGPVIWFNNEEQDNKVLLRIVQSYFGIKLDVLMANVKHYNKEFNEAVGKKILLVNSSKIDINKINVERIIEARKPSLIIYDQIDKIKGFKADRDDLVLGYIYQWARELAKKYAPSIGVCQADGTGEGQKWLTMANVANAKTSKQAEADFILGIGKTHDEAAEYVRYINISKNKLMGDSDSDPAMRHARLESIIDPEICRYKDILKYD